MVIMVLMELSQMFPIRHQHKGFMVSSLSNHMGDGKVKLGRGPYAISTAILSMYAGFQHPGTKYMLAPGHRKLTLLCGFSCGFAKFSI